MLSRSDLGGWVVAAVPLEHALFLRDSDESAGLENARLGQCAEFRLDDRFAHVGKASRAGIVVPKATLVQLDAIFSHAAPVVGLAVVPVREAQLQS